MSVFNKLLNTSIKNKIIYGSLSIVLILLLIFFTLGLLDQWFINFVRSPYAPYFGRFLIGVTSVAILFVTLTIYLNRGLLSSPPFDKIPQDTIKPPTKSIREAKVIKEITQDIEELRNSFNQLLEKSFPSREIDINTLTDSIRDQALLNLPEKLTQELEQKYALKFIEQSQIELIRENLTETTNRLHKEIEAAGRRSNLNLIIGIITTGFAAILLAFIAFEIKPSFDNTTALLAHYIPRITTIIFVEVFAFFFLRLYKTGLSEIKYFQNELTNIQLQKIAIEAALLPKLNTSMEGVIQQLIKTERNSISGIDSKNNGENSLSIKDANSIIEALSKFSGKS
ncbi:MAG TPA: hypothetical protein VF571_20450 [Pyrinomonadaceae bacterium]|jgi:hypothetical protein